MANNIKLKEFCARNSISYITGYRWFKDGQIAGAFQTDSKTILVPENAMLPKVEDTSNDALSLFLTSTVEFIKNNATVEEFASFVIANFQLKLNASTYNDLPKFKIKSKELVAEDAQSYINQNFPFSKDKMEELKEAKIKLTEGKSVGDKVPASSFEELATFDKIITPQIAEIMEAHNDTEFNSAIFVRKEEDK